MHLYPEDQLLILCSRTQLNEEIEPKVSALLKQDLDWDYLLRAAIQHSTAILLYHNLYQLTTKQELSNKSWPGWPEKVKTQLEALYLNSCRRTERLQKVLFEIFEAFKNKNIPLIALKELGVIPQAYPMAALHPVGDLDLLIHKKDYDRAEKQLEALGFVPWPDKNHTYQLTYDAEYQFHRPSDNIWLDIQWDIENKELDGWGEGSLNFGVERIWQNAQYVQRDDYHHLTPAPVDMLLHLCLHLEGHGYTELILLTDIAEAIRAYGDKLAWDELVKLANCYGVQSTIYYVLWWVRTFFNPPIPDKVFEALTPPYFKAHLFEALFGNLIPLNSYLDEIVLTASPPDEVKKKFEILTRRQAVGAMRLYQIIDTALLAFKTAGGANDHFDGARIGLCFSPCGPARF